MSQQGAEPDAAASPIDEAMMERALKLAAAAAAIGEIPVGAVVYETATGRVLGEAHNLRHTQKDPTAHAELLAIKAAAMAVGDWRLNHCTLVVTLEPCAMCAGLIVNARLGRVVYGCADPKAGACESLYRLTNDARLNHRVAPIGAVMAERSALLLRESSDRAAERNSRATGVVRTVLCAVPELPEVESIRRTLMPRLIGRRIVEATLHRRDVLVGPGDPFGGFSRQRGRGAKPKRVLKSALLLDAAITRIDRRGKQLAIIGAMPDEQHSAIIVQLGMSGQLFHRAAGQRVLESSHIHARWRLDDGGRLLFRDPRRFGGLRTLASVEALDEHWRTLGPDALDIDGARLAAGLAGSTRAIKAALLDQSVIAGVGNIYADEALFASGISPARLAQHLGDAECDRLARAIREVLVSAIEAGGSTLRDYVDADGNPGSFQLRHKVYGRGGEPCETCGRVLKTGTIAQRTTVWCGMCQR